MLLLTLGREHTGENTFVVMLRSMTNLLSYFKCKHFVSINQDIWILPTSSPKWYYRSISISLYDEDVVCLGLRDGDGGNGTVTKQTTRAATVANVTMAQTPTSISCVL